MDDVIQAATRKVVQVPERCFDFIQKLSLDGEHP